MPVTDPGEEYFKDGIWAWDAAGETWVKLACDPATGYLYVDAQTVALPTGAATETTLAAINTELAAKLETADLSFDAEGRLNVADPWGAPRDAKFVVTELTADLTAELLHSGLTGADLHDPAAHKASHAGGGADKLKYTRQIMWFIIDATLATGTDKSATIVYRGPTLTLVRWDFRAKTAPTSAAMIADVNVGGTSLWNATQANRPTIAAAATSGTGTSFDTTTLSDGDVLTLDIDQVGSGTAGGQVTLILEGECNPEAA